MKTIKMTFIAVFMLFLALTYAAGQSAITYPKMRISARNAHLEFTLNIYTPLDSDKQMIVEFEGTYSVDQTIDMLECAGDSRTADFFRALTSTRPIGNVQNRWKIKKKLFQEIYNTAVSMIITNDQLISEIHT